MRKIAEIDSVEAYRGGATESVWLNAWSSRRKRINPEWLKLALAPAQLEFVLKHEPVFRSHPRHSPTVELFVDDRTMTERDWTIAGLLF